VADLDQFVSDLSKRMSPRTIGDTCSSLRAFLRFLRATNRLPHDLANYVIAPRFRPAAQPPRALAWADVQRLIRAIPRTPRCRKRDTAILLLMASYGLGAAEVLGLDLDDVDWKANVLHVRRPKTAVTTDLPLLPPIARALADYLRRERPRDSVTRRIFVSTHLPYPVLTSAAIRHRIRECADRAGITTARLGTHAFRHSHATRQIDAGAPPKVVSDILGHRRASSMSVYIRVALRRLRTVALPVPQ
jgi:integrase